MIRQDHPVRREILYPIDLIRRTLRSVYDRIEPVTIDQVIEFTDIQTTFKRLPRQYQDVLDLWVRTDGDYDQIAAELGRELTDARVTIKSAWNYFYDLLNGEPSG